jgi:hypothetical protein
VARLRERIRPGEIAARLPALTSLTRETGTVRRAVDTLAGEQLVRPVPDRALS